MDDKSDACNYFENDVDEIVPNLWLGNYESSNSVEFLENNNIRYIIRLVKEFEFDPRDQKIIKDKNIIVTDFGFIYHRNGCTYYHFPIADSDMCYKNMNQLFEQTNNIICKKLKNRDKILVHCKKGHHRSATVVGAFLIKHLGIDYIETVIYINSIRKCALRRDACMVHGLFKYFMKINNIECEKIDCFKKDSYYVCSCKEIQNK